MNVKPRQLAIASTIVLLAQLVGSTGAIAVSADARWLGADGNPLPFEEDAAVLEFLRTATVVSSQEIGGSQNKPLKLLLEKDGVRAHAVFRRVDRSWRHAWVRGIWRSRLVDRASSERGAYIVAELLGFDNVPPTVLREIDGDKGSLQLWIEDAESLAELGARRGPLPPRFTEQMAAIAALDKLVYNVDRHPRNILVGRDGTLWMIDHTQAFQHDQRLLEADALQSIPEAMWSRLTIIPEAVFARALEGTLEDSQVDAFLARRRSLIERVEKLISDRGEGRVLRAYSDDRGTAFSS
jgi:hypothetical protein